MATENFWKQSVDAVIKTFKTDSRRGLSLQNVEENRKEFGSNTLEEIKPASALSLILEGLSEPEMIILLAIGGLSLIFRETTEAVAMIFVVAAYITVEFINEYRSDRTMTKLKTLTSPTARVIREGRVQEVPTRELVNGDVLILSEGVRLGADARLIEAVGLSTNEASLTGESLPVAKTVEDLAKIDLPLAERKNMVFSGTTILNGEGKAVVVAVGGQSELGKIATQVGKTKKERTVLQQAMKRLAQILSIYAIIVSILIPAVGLLRGLNFQSMIVTWLALTFLMVPGQPPIIITMSLALASFRLAKIKLVVKRLSGVESLSQVTAIVTDKTGTITENRMQVEAFILPDGEEISPDKIPIDLKKEIFSALPRYSNDPTDEAVREVVQGSLVNEMPISLAGFSEEQPWRTIEYKINGGIEAYLAGQTEILLSKAEMSENQKLLAVIGKATENGKRVVAYAKKKGGLPKVELVALAVLADPIREGVADTLASLKKAAVKTFIVTGDHPRTAAAIARSLGLTGEIITGSQLKAMNETKLEEILAENNVFARIDPTEKLRLVEALKKKGEVVAVIGDGVNDAPALKAANVGIAMGEIGTDLAKETADLILSDDNYAHIAEAVGIARSAMDNFRKGLTYYLTAKAILLVIFLVPLAFGIPFPFAPIHIILTELLMDLASSTIFVTEAAEPDVLGKGVRPFKDFLGWELVSKILKNGWALALAISALYLILYFKTGNLALAQSAAFVTWLIGHILLALNLKQENLPLSKQGFLANRFGFGWLLGMVIFALIITFVNPLHLYMKTASVSWPLWLVIIGAVTFSTFWIEFIKLAKWRRKSVQ